MAKGDREILKADIDDGFTKIANLLLEALAMCKINGTQKSMCLFLFRRTYGWGKSEDAISLSDFAAACGTSKSYISRQIKDLLKKNIIKRVSYEPGKTPVYTFNTKIDEWDSQCIDLQKLIENVNEGIYNCEGVTQIDKGYTNVQGLHKEISQGLHKCERVGLSDCARVNQSQRLDATGFEAPLNKDLKKYKEIYIDDDDNNARARARTTDEPKKADNVPAIIVSFEGEFGRPLSPMEVQHIREWAREFTDEMLLEALKRASLAGRPTVAYIRGILTNWKKNNVRTLRDVAEMDKQFRARDKPKRSPPEPLVVDYEAAKNSKYGW